MTKGLFTSLEEIKFQQDYATPVARPSSKRKRIKHLFTSLEEIKFQDAYVRGNAEKAYDPNTKIHPQKHLVAKRKNKHIPKVFLIRTR